MRATERPAQYATDVLQTTTLRDFSGGWNAVDTDLNLKPIFAKTLLNCFLANEGTIAVRYGTQLHANVALAVRGWIVNGIYHNQHLVVVMSSGEIAKIDAAGVATKIWDNAIAAALPGAPSGWGPTVFVTLTVFHGQVTVHNGIDKPLLIDQDFVVTYLSDPATGSNVNTPVCRYAAALPRYLVLAGDPTDPSLIHISNIDSPGTFFGDPDPNDAITLDIGPYVPVGDTIIKGIAAYRNRLVVMLDECLLFFTLGVYEGDPPVHVPKSEAGDAIQQYGTISHRSIATVDDDLLFCDLIGVPSLSRSTFVSDFKPDRVSLLIDPEIQKIITRILSTTKLEDHVWAVYNKLDKEFMLFAPGSRLHGPDEFGFSRYDRRVFVYRRVKGLNIEAWSEFGGVQFSFSAGCMTGEGRLMLFDGTEVYRFGSDREPIYADRVNAGDVPAGGDAFEGHSISWDWELPWADFGSRGILKITRYLNFDTTGTARFTARMYADNVRVDDHGEDAPVCQLRFRGGDSPGFGAGPYGDEPGFGGGRPTRRPGLYSWTARGQLLKLRMSGNDIRPLRFVSIVLMWLAGGIRR